ncbi:MAG TPA: hypothetical protein PKY30_06805 [Myxococcota bacterium]|nr:hypothetical protein [Myxococcota bacterium]HNH46728.1 hypothetical protein [Myxococcota bacterium]
MAESRAKGLLIFTLERLTELLKYPAMWGGAESVELQVLQLLEIRLKLVGAGEDDLDALKGRYLAFLAREVGGAPTLLHKRLGLERQSSPDFIRLLTRFAGEEVQRNFPFSATARATKDLPSSMNQNQHYELEQ